MTDGDGIGSPLDLTRRMFASASAHDFDTMLKAFGPASVWDASPWALGSHTGGRAIRRFVERWIDSFDEWEIKPSGMADLGHGVVYATAVQVGRTRGNPEPFLMRQASVFLWRDSLVVRVTHYPDMELARGEADRLAEAEA